MIIPADTMPYAYPGAELELFKHAVRWKRYYAGELAPYIRGDVLEVGAGIGVTSRFLCEARHSSWTSLEPDPQLAWTLRDDVAARPLPAPMVVREGTIRELPDESRFDSVLYIDVLEHIEDDRAELPGLVPQNVAGRASEVSVRGVRLQSNPSY